MTRTQKNQQMIKIFRYAGHGEARECWKVCYCVLFVVRRLTTEDTKLGLRPYLLLPLSVAWSHRKTNRHTFPVTWPPELSMATFHSFRKAVGALKDSTTVGIAKVNSEFKVRLHFQFSNYPLFQNSLKWWTKIDFEIEIGFGCCDRQGHKSRRICSQRTTYS